MRVFTSRPKGLGVGAEVSVRNQGKDPSSSEEKILKKSAYVRIDRGIHKYVLHFLRTSIFSSSTDEAAYKLHTMFTERFLKLTFFKICIVCSFQQMCSTSAFTFTYFGYVVALNMTTYIIRIVIDQAIFFSIE